MHQVVLLIEGAELTSVLSCWHHPILSSSWQPPLKLNLHKFLALPVLNIFLEKQKS